MGNGFNFFNEERVDLTDLYTFCLDKGGTHNFSDALSIEEDDKFHYLYIHITDTINASTYHHMNIENLKMRSIIFDSNMLNEAHSLNCGKKRNAITVKTVISKAGTVKEYDFFKSEISSNVQIKYSKANKVIKNCRTDKNCYLKLLEIADLYDKTDFNRSKRPVSQINNKANCIVAAWMNLHSDLAAKEMIEKGYLDLFGNSILKHKSYRDMTRLEKYKMKWTSPIHSFEEHIAQMIFHDLILNEKDNKEELVDFWQNVVTDLYFFNRPNDNKNSNKTLTLKRY